VVDVASVVVVGVDVVVVVTFAEVAGVVVVVGAASGIPPPQPQSSTAIAPMTSPSDPRLHTRGFWPPSRRRDGRVRREDNQGLGLTRPDYASSPGPGFEDAELVVLR
jgi:hypothetical protein